MNTALHTPVDVAAWLPVFELARHVGVSRQAVHKRIGKLGDRLAVKGEGRGMRVHVETYLALTGAAHDPAQDLRNHAQRSVPRGGAQPVPPPSAPLAAPFATIANPAPKPAVSEYEGEKTLSIRADRELRELKLAQQRRELVPVRDVEAAAAAIATGIRQRLDTLKASFTRLHAASRQGGEDAVRVELSRMVDDLQRGIVADMTRAASLDDTPADPLAADPASDPIADVAIA